jgi:hypothetical protein
VFYVEHINAVLPNSVADAGIDGYIPEASDSQRIAGDRQRARSACRTRAV